METTLRNLATAAVGLALLLVGCGGPDQQAGGFQRPPTPVETAPVVTGPVIDRFTTVGTLEAGEAIVVTAEIDGVVEALPFPEGGHLDRGDLIVRLDDRQLAAEARRAAALKDQAHATWTRVQSVVDQGAGAPQDLDDATAALKVAEANLALAETRLAKTRITAPFAGLAGARRVSPGAFLRAGSAVTELAQIDRLRVTFAVPERILGALHTGAAIHVETPAFPDAVLRGTIDVIAPQLDPVTRNASIVARVDNPDELLRPGMSATVSVTLSERDSALSVPSEAVFVEGGQNWVYVVRPDSVVTRTPVELGSRLADAVEVTAGVAAGEVVVRAGHQKLFDGAKVTPVGAGAGGPQEDAAR
ncbi:MAG: efflux RND transporter periplasmic adaptor subunit [Krumholzibacteria bacterium]|nr:efflux RND transporter periplasmic adaptor subunit [Candidatus Krumholzibacteria bacterium]